MSARDPYHDHKVYHMAHKLDANGNVSALCFKTPRAINMSRASWTVRIRAVTCPKCKAALADAAQPKAQDQ